MEKDKYQSKYFDVLQRLKKICDEKEYHDKDYKQAYHTLMQRLYKLEYSAEYERCPPIKSCCGICNELKHLLKKEKDGRPENNPGSNE